MIESYNIWIALTTTPKPPTGASKPNSRWTIQRFGNYFIDGLKKVQKGHEHEHEHEQLVAGHAPRKLRRYQLCDERIERIVQNYANYGIMDYLRGLAHNFEMN